MPTIQAQLEWEQRMVEHGVQRYRAQQDAAANGHRTHETSAGSTLLRSYILQISDNIREYLSGNHRGGRRRSKYAPLLDTIDTDKVAMLALKAIIATLYTPTPAQSVLIGIGRCIEDDLRFTKFQAEYKNYYDALIRDFDRKGTTSYDHKRRVLGAKSRDQGMSWETWDRDVHFGVGALVVSLLMEVCDLAEVTHVPRGRGQKDALIGPTKKCIGWVMKHNEFSELGNPDKMPCIIPPADWTSNFGGGYYSPALQERRVGTLVKRWNQGKRSKQHMNFPAVLSAVNAMQRTPWELNRRVLAVMREVWAKNLQIGMPRTEPYVVPPSPVSPDMRVSELPEGHPTRVAFEDWKAEAREIYTMEKERIAQNLALSRTFRIATDMEQYDRFWYVYQCDFRGRIYSATTGLSPQGTDNSKALLRFAEGKALGATGWYWLRVHGANKYGFDKVPYDERVQWVDDRHEHWLRAADDPIANRDVWKDADKPYQFLAWLFEYADAVRNPGAFVSRLPVALDGSCNGLQHFSAMLRDSVGGAAVNLTPGDRPADIYQVVGDVCTRKLKGLRSLNTEESGGATNWLALFQQVWGDERMMRSLPKKPVMTLPYGSTQQACTETIFRWIHDNNPTFFENNTNFRHAMYLSPRLWSSISEVVVAAREAMDWLQRCAGILARDGHAICYTTPLGFPVYQATYQYKSRQIETQINGRLQLRLAYDTDKLDGRKQRQGSSPNFVHSVDATHMMMCINAGAAAGITSFAMIHDDFGVHACDTDRWQGIIREEFVKLHSTDLLSSFKEQHEQLYDIELPELPAKGSLVLADVLTSPYFFG